MYEYFRFADKEKEYVVPLPYEFDLGIVNKLVIRGREFVPIVRCGDCRWFDRSEPSGTVEPIGFRCMRKRIFVESDDFCKRGERREE